MVQIPVRPSVASTHPQRPSPPNPVGKDPHPSGPPSQFPNLAVHQPSPTTISPFRLLISSFFTPPLPTTTIPQTHLQMTQHPSPQSQTPTPRLSVTHKVGTRIRTAIPIQNSEKAMLANRARRSVDSTKDVKRRSGRADRRSCARMKD